MSEKSNERLLTWICYLCYFFTGSLVTVTGVVLAPIAAFYNCRPGDIAYIFTVQNAPMFIIIIVGGFLMKNVSLKKLFLIGIIAEFAGLAIVQIFLDITFSFVLFMGIVGFSGGMFMCLASFLIVRLYNDPKSRSTRLVMADFFFSFSGVVVPLVASQLLAHNVFWLVIYYLITLVGVLMLFMVVASKFPDIVAETQSNQHLYNEKWGLSVYLVSAACFFFIMGELVFAQWFPLYLQQYLKLSIARSGEFASLFWLFMAIGLFVGRFVMKKFKLAPFITVCFLLATFFLFILSVVPSEYVVMVAVILCGFFNSIVYACLIAYGSLQVKHTPPTIIAFILGCGTLGTMCSSPVSGFIANNIGIHAALNSSWVLYIIGFILFLLTCSFSKAEKIHGEIRGSE
jgi:MFS transporter, TsgA protein